MATTINQRTAATFLGAMVLTCIAAATYVLSVGIDDESITLALRVSGRVAFAVLTLAFAARPLQQLLKAPWTAKLLRNRRQVGVAFAGIHTAHLGLILMRANHVPEFGNFLNVPGAFVYLVIYAMLITSFTGPARVIGPKAWKVLHKVGIFVLFGAFLNSQLPRSFEELEWTNGLLIAMATTALLLRVVAFFRRRRPRPQ